MQRCYGQKQTFWLQTNSNHLDNIIQFLNPMDPKKDRHHIELPLVLVQLFDILLLKMQFFLCRIALFRDVDLVCGKVIPSHLVNLHLLFDECLVQVKSWNSMPTAQIQNFQWSLHLLMVGLDSSGKTLDGRFVDGPLKMIILDVSFVEMFTAVRLVCQVLHRLSYLSYQQIQLVILNQMRICFIPVLLLLLATSLSQKCRGKENPYPAIEANFTKVSAHKFGQKYHFFSKELNQNYYSIKIWGTPYQAGLAYGTLMKQEIKGLISDMWSYYHGLIEQQFKWITKLPPRLQPMGRTLAIAFFKNLLYANHIITKSFTPKHFLEQYSGISEGSGVSVKELAIFNMIPEYTRAGCSILGSWGKATLNGNLLHLRALDWDESNPINKYPLFVFYNLTTKGSQPFVNLVWAGFIGSITGFSQYTGVGQSNRVQKPVKENQTRIGKPWTYALRDVIQFTSTIEKSLESLQKTRRTCSIYVGISSVKSNTFRLVEYSHKEFKVYDDHNYTYTAAHNQMDNVVSYAIHEDQGDTCFNDLIKGKYGNMTNQWVTNTLAASHHTGDTQLATYNFDTKELYFQVSNSSKLAFQRPVVKVNLGPFFNF